MRGTSGESDGLQSAWPGCILSAGNDPPVPGRETVGILIQFVHRRNFDFWSCAAALIMPIHGRLSLN
jgi:hypothetical protein